MARIYVEFDKLTEIGNALKEVSIKTNDIRFVLHDTVTKLDWDMKCSSSIELIAGEIENKLDSYTYWLRGYQQFVDGANMEYQKLEDFFDKRAESFSSHT